MKSKYIPSNTGKKVISKENLLDTGIVSTVITPFMTMVETFGTNPMDNIQSIKSRLIAIGFISLFPAIDDLFEVSYNTFDKIFPDLIKKEYAEIGYGACLGLLINMIKYDALAENKTFGENLLMTSGAMLLGAATYPAKNKILDAVREGVGFIKSNENIYKKRLMVTTAIVLSASTTFYAYHQNRIIVNNIEQEKPKIEIDSSLQNKYNPSNTAVFMDYIK